MGSLEEDVDFLSHHGSKGMRWGNRQKTNENLRRWKKENKAFKALNSKRYTELTQTAYASLRQDVSKKAVLSVGAIFINAFINTNTSSQVDSEPRKDSTRGSRFSTRQMSKRSSHRRSQV